MAINSENKQTGIIGCKTRCSNEYRPLKGCEVIVVAVIKSDSMGGYAYLTNDISLQKYGGVKKADIIEVAPVDPKTGKRSFVTYDPPAAMVECFAHLKETDEFEIEWEGEEAKS